MLPPFRVNLSPSKAKFYFDCTLYEQLSEESTLEASSFMIELDENPVKNGHHRKISKVVLSSKHKSRKFVSFEEIPSFRYKLEKAEEFKNIF